MMEHIYLAGLRPRQTLDHGEAEAGWVRHYALSLAEVPRVCLLGRVPGLSPYKSRVQVPTVEIGVEFHSCTPQGPGEPCASHFLVTGQHRLEAVSSSTLPLPLGTKALPPTGIGMCQQGLPRLTSGREAQRSHPDFRFEVSGAHVA